MPPRTRRSAATASIPQGTNENRDPMKNTTHTREFRQEQATPGPGVSTADTSITRMSPVLLGV